MDIFFLLTFFNKHGSRINKDHMILILGLLLETRVTTGVIFLKLVFLEYCVILHYRRMNSVPAHDKINVALKMLCSLYVNMFAALTTKRFEFFRVESGLNRLHEKRKPKGRQLIKLNVAEKSRQTTYTATVFVYWQEASRRRVAPECVRSTKEDNKFLKGPENHIKLTRVMGCNRKLTGKHRPTALSL